MKPKLCDFRRVLDSPDVPEEYKDKLRQLYAKSNPGELERKIEGLQGKLLKTALAKIQQVTTTGYRKSTIVKLKKNTYKYQEIGV